MKRPHPSKSRLCLAVILVLSAGMLLPAPGGEPSQAETDGAELVRKLLSFGPDQKEVRHSGTLRIENRDGFVRTLPLVFSIDSLDAETWKGIYEAEPDTTNRIRLTILHRAGKPNEYELVSGGSTNRLSGAQAMQPFAGSDFWLADLGLEFFHWPRQKIVKKEMTRSRSCKVLESADPAITNGYCRVLSWIDNETGGVVAAEAYTPGGRKIKVFRPKDFQKVEGQWELKEMRISNPVDDTQSTVEFNFK
jgi:hypothetical protein